MTLDWQAVLTHIGSFAAVGTLVIVGGQLLLDLRSRRRTRPIFEAWVEPPRDGATLHVLRITLRNNAEASFIAHKLSHSGWRRPIFVTDDHATEIDGYGGVNTRKATANLPAVRTIAIGEIVRPLSAPGRLGDTGRSFSASYHLQDPPRRFSIRLHWSWSDRSDRRNSTTKQIRTIRMPA